MIFTFASLMNGLASSEGMLIAFRALQGLGAALISPAALSIISTTFAEGAERAKALAVWAAIAIGGAAVGLVLGGALVEYFSWPWIFFVNVPVGIVAFVLSLRLVPESRDEHAPRELRHRRRRHGHRRADGARLRDRQGRDRRLDVDDDDRLLRPRRRSCSRASCVIESRTQAPLVRLSIFKIRSLTTANIVMFLAMSGMFAMFFFNTLYIQRVLGYSPLKAGLAFLPFTAGDHGLGRARLELRAEDRRPARRRRSGWS